MTSSSRRTFVRQAALLVAGAQAGRWVNLAAADAGSVTAVTSSGTVRGTVTTGSGCASLLWGSGGT